MLGLLLFLILIWFFFVFGAGMLMMGLHLSSGGKKSIPVRTVGGTIAALGAALLLAGGHLNQYQGGMCICGMLEIGQGIWLESLGP